MDHTLIAFVSKRAIENDYQVNHFFRFGGYDEPSFSGWHFMHGDEEEDYFESENNFEFLPLSDVILNCPYIREYLDLPVGARLVYERETGKIRDWELKRTLSFDRKIYAPDGANIKLEPWVWLRYFPGSLVSPIISSFFLLLAVFHRWPWVLVAAFFATRAIVNWVAIYEHFKFGQALAGVVVSVKPKMIAVLARFEGGSNPGLFVKTTKIKLKQIDGRKIEVGDRVGTAALYNTISWHLRSNNCFPMPINYATSDPEKIERVFRGFTEDDWAELERAVSQLRIKRREKLYKVADLIHPDESLPKNQSIPRADVKNQ